MFLTYSVTDSSITNVPIDGGFNITGTFDNVTIQTSYLYSNCNDTEQDALKTAANDAVDLAWESLIRITLPGGVHRNIVNFNLVSAIDYFGPKSQNKDQQEKILCKSQAALSLSPIQR